MRASVLQRVAEVEAELRRFVAGYVRRELDKPHVRDGADDRRLACHRPGVAVALADAARGGPPEDPDGTEAKSG